MEEKNNPDCLKIAIVGPESTGKTTLAEGLARHFDLPWVSEYAREFLESRDGTYEESDLLLIAMGQLEQEVQVLSKNVSLLICDTNLLSMRAWGDFKYGRTDPWIVEEAQRRYYDISFLMDIDVPWEVDPLRENPDPEERKALFDLHRKLLDDTGARYVVLSGGEEQRLKFAIDTLEIFLKKQS